MVIARGLLNATKILACRPARPNSRFLSCAGVDLAAAQNDLARRLISGNPMSQTAQTAPLRIALAGAGGLGRTWAKVVLAEPAARLCAFVDPLIGTEKQSAWLDEMPDVPRFASLEAMTEEVDALLVTAFSTAHADRRPGRPRTRPTCHR